MSSGDEGSSPGGDPSARPRDYYDVVPADPDAKSDLVVAEGGVVFRRRLPWSVDPELGGLSV